MKEKILRRLMELVKEYWGIDYAICTLMEIDNLHTIRHPAAIERMVRDIVQSKKPLDTLLAKYAKDHETVLRKVIAAYERTDSKIVDMIADQDEDLDVQIEAACNPVCSDAMKEKVIGRILEEDSECAEEVICEILKNSSTRFCTRMSKSHARAVRLACAQIDNCSQAVYRRLATDEDSKVRDYAGMRVKSEEILMQLISEDNPSIDFSIACNPNCTEKLFKILLKRGDEQNLSVVAENPACGNAILKKLVKHKDEVISAAAAKNKNLSDQLIRMFAKDGGFRISIASNPNCPLDILEELSFDSNPDVRLAVAGNVNATDDILYRLYCDDINIDVKVEAGSNISAIHDYDMFVITDFRQISEGYLRNERLTARDLKEALVACNFLSFEEKEKILARIVNHPSCTESVIELIIKHDNYFSYMVKVPWILDNICRNKRFAQEILNYFIENA